MSGHRIGYDHGMALTAGLLKDPGANGTLVLDAGSGFNTVILGTTSQTSIVLPASQPGTVVIAVNNSGGAVEVSDGTSNVCSLADAEVGLAVALTAAGLWRGVVLHSTST